MSGDLTVIEHSIDVKASRQAAWDFWSDVRNWEDPPARFELDGPFSAGTWGTTVLPGQSPVRWRLRDVTPPARAVVEIELERATLAFAWRFEVSGSVTRVTQRVLLSGENAPAYAEPMKEAFAGNLPAGMARLAAAMEASAT
jgi:hypothetical protein